MMANDCGLQPCLLDSTISLVNKSVTGIEELNQMLCRLLKMQELNGVEERMANTVIEWLEVKKMIEENEVEEPSSWGKEEPSSRGKEVPNFDSNYISKKKMQEQHEGNSESAI